MEISEDSTNTIGGKIQASLGGNKVAHQKRTIEQYMNEYWGLILPHLEELPREIFITLGGNGGSSGAADLINMIQEVTPDSKITWIGPPPPAKGGSVYPFSDRRFEDRRNYNKEIEGAVSWFDNVRFINSYEVPGFENGYQCYGKCDGIHLKNELADQFIESANIL